MTVNPTPAFWNGKRVLVTGHTGFKGSWLTLWMSEMGADVLGISLDVGSPEGLFATGAIHNRCKSLLADLNSVESWGHEVQDFQPEIVLHLAAQSLVYEGYRLPVETFETNVLGTVRLLSQLQQLSRLKAVVVATTDKVYRDVHLMTPFVEDDHLGGHDPYSASKAACELAVASLSKSFLAPLGIAVSTARAGNVIGGGDWAAHRIIPDAVRAWSKNQPLEIRNPDAVRPWQHVLEPLSGYLLLAEKSFTHAELAGPYNFGPDPAETMSVGELVARASSAFGGGSVVHCEPPAKMHESEWLHLDSSRALSELGYKPRLSLQQSIEWTMNWYRAYIAKQHPLFHAIQQIHEFVSMGKYQSENPL